MLSHHTHLPTREAKVHLVCDQGVGGGKITTTGDSLMQDHYVSV